MFQNMVRAQYPFVKFRGVYTFLLEAQRKIGDGHHGIGLAHPPGWTDSQFPTEVCSHPWGERGGVSGEFQGGGHC